MDGTPNASRQQEMVAESAGQQPVVVMMWLNGHGAKGHSLTNIEDHFNRQGSRRQTLAKPMQFTPTSNKEVIRHWLKNLSIQNQSPNSE